MDVEQWVSHSVTSSVGIDSLGQLRPPELGPHGGSHGSTLVADAHGLLVVERDAGVVVRASFEGEAMASVALSRGLGEIVRDAGSGRVFVADRGGHQIVELAPGDAEGRGLARRGSASVREPHGLALSPDGQTLLVTSVADHALVAFDVSGEVPRERWRVELSPEPRGVAVSPDGRRAVIGFLSTGALAFVDLPSPRADSGASEPLGPRVSYRSLEPRDQLRVEIERFDEFDADVSSSVVEAKSRFEVPTETGRRYARNAFAVAFVGHGLAVTAHQLATPQLTRRPPSTGTYGGGESFSPITHSLAFVAPPGLDGAAGTAKLSAAALNTHMPRALTYALATDTLYVAGYGDDRVEAVGDASQASVHRDWSLILDGDKACGIDGLTVAAGKLWVHCEFGRRLVAIDLDPVERDAKLAVHYGDELTPAVREPEVELGAELFRRSADRRLTLDGTLACAQCHPEGRSDGLSWRLEGAILQTPMLAGRLVGTAPYKWDGQDLDLKASLFNTIGRLGGFPHSMRGKELRALRAYLESLAPPQTPTPRDPEAIARGRAVFESPEAACDACHAGGRLTDGSAHDLDTSLPMVDTPSLLGVAHSAPYYHDGSAVDLAALLDNRSTIHDMADVSGLAPGQIADLTAYLESL